LHLQAYRAITHQAYDAFAFLDPVRAAPHLRIAGGTTARRLLIGTCP
jgi:hypothetical protein